MRIKAYVLVDVSHISLIGGDFIDIFIIEEDIPIVFH